MVFPTVLISYEVKYADSFFFRFSGIVAQDAKHHQI